MSSTATALFNALNEALLKVNAPIDAAEAHGIICGAVCLNIPIEDDTWLNRILENDAEDSTHQTARNILLRLKDYVLSQLGDGNYDLGLLLPDDDESLSDRSSALVNWCNGFLFGLGVSSAGEIQQWSDDTQEFVRDVSQFTKIDLNIDENEVDELENAYMEIFEYIRIGVLNIYQEHFYQQQRDKPRIH